LSNAEIEDKVDVWRGPFIVEQSSALLHQLRRMAVCWERYIDVYDVEHRAQAMNRRIVATVTARSRPQSERALSAA
jgi:hypothetical protein